MRLLFVLLVSVVATSLAAAAPSDQWKINIYAGLPPEEVALKVGVHHGPCLAVRANDRLDFFGTTVNIASRLQCQARRDQVVVLAELTAHPEIAATLRTGYRVERFRAQLKGLRATQTLVSIDQAPATPPLAEAAPELEVYVGW